MAPTLFTALMLAPLLASAQVFTVLYQQGTECTGTRTGIYRGPADHGDHNVCLDVPALGVTTTISFSAEQSNEQQYILRLHSDPDCNIISSSFQAPPDRPICVDTLGSNYVSVVAEPLFGPFGASTMDSIAVVEETRDNDNKAIDVRPRGDLAARQTLRALIDCAVVQQTFQWVDMTITSCGEIATKETAAEQAAAGVQCAWRGTVSVFFGILSVYELRRLRTAPAPGPGTPRLKRSEVFAEILEVGQSLPVDDDLLIPGMTTTVKFLEDGSHILDEGRALEEAHWPLMEITTVSKQTGERLTSYAEKALFTDHARTWSDGLTPASEGSTSLTNSAKFARQKRQATYTVYFASEDLQFEQWDQMDKSEAAIEDLAFTAWRFIYTNRSDKHCASLYYTDFNGQPQYFMAGYYGVVSGVFNENTDQCPAPSPFRKTK